MLLAILALGLVTMHHAPAEHGLPGHGSATVVAMVPGTSPALSAAPMPDDHGMGAMLHECLAVLGQLAFGALLVLLVMAGFGPLSTRCRRRCPRALARSPDRPASPGGRSLLASVCVLRL
ncbi:hypothetical protein FG385_28705 [Amycolatopsis alkalitolerans]|uniref:Uncharacterized protein n=1 Tax=Amycolatopsis alkalitolerans TaxID=2547244 RepID=A0A5C4LSI9_9PSEU|nr:hypothetical protein FG385_28705 [Amycolatopsis alkalitolerans]